ncbi:MAG: tRNA (N(6)-L-threonylcarbamoyladenosine(37)-C(2))-methylthiotransferase [archaeon]
MRIHVEGYGCSMNLAETEMIRGHAKENGASIGSVSDSDFLVVNTCAVKEQTEFKMLGRIRKLNQAAEKNGSQLIVFGCLPKVSPHLIEGISPNIIQMGPDLEKLSQVLGIKEAPFSPSINALRDNPNVTIMPINRGCTNFCTFCGTKFARGNVNSFPIEHLKRRFVSSLPDSREFWLTSQDTGAYGLDIGTSLPELLRGLLLVQGEYRIRIGMMNPHHLRRIYDSLVPLFSDGRVYRFLHVPLQAGSNRILALMRRGYTVEQYYELIGDLRRDVPDITIATDVIAGFPTETEAEFSETLKAIKETSPDIVNISRFGARPGTIAASMDGQLHGRIKKERSRRLASLCRAISFRQNGRMLGKTERVFVSEEGVKGRFMGRSSNYKPVIISEDLRGKFADVEITSVFPTYLEAKVISAEREKPVLRGLLAAK